MLNAEYWFNKTLERGPGQVEGPFTAVTRRDIDDIQSDAYRHGVYDALLKLSRVIADLGDDFRHASAPSPGPPDAPPGPVAAG